MTDTSLRSNNNDNSNRKRKVAIITGSDRGIGRAIALGFAKSDTYAGIVVNARKRNEAERVAKEVMYVYINQS